MTRHKSQHPDTRSGEASHARTIAAMARVLLTKRLDVDFCRVATMRCLLS